MLGVCSLLKTWFIVLEDNIHSAEHENALEALSALTLSLVGQYVSLKVMPFFHAYL